MAARLGKNMPLGWVVVMFLVVSISGCVNDVEVPSEYPQEIETDVEAVGGRYNGEIVSIEGVYQGQDYTRYIIRYEINGSAMEHYFIPELRDPLSWMVENTPEDAVFFDWWDYGHMIRGFTGRDVVLFSPSEDMLWSVSSGYWNETASGPMADSEVIRDVAFGFLTSDASELTGMMEKHDAGYVFVTAMDEVVVRYWLDRFGLLQYVTEERVNSLVSELVLFRMLNGEVVEGFDKVYSDDFVKIYRLVPQNP